MAVLIRRGTCTVLREGPQCPARAGRQPLSCTTTLPASRARPLCPSHLQARRRSGDHDSGGQHLERPGRTHRWAACRRSRDDDVDGGHGRRRQRDRRAHLVVQLVRNGGRAHAQAGHRCTRRADPLDVSARADRRRVRSRSAAPRWRRLTSREQSRFSSRRGPGSLRRCSDRSSRTAQIRSCGQETRRPGSSTSCIGRAPECWTSTMRSPAATTVLPGKISLGEGTGGSATLTLDQQRCSGGHLRPRPRGRHLDRDADVRTTCVRLLAAGHAGDVQPRERHSACAVERPR